MKKLQVVLVLLVVMFATNVFASSKYDIILKSPAIPQLNTTYQKHIGSDRAILDYMNLLLNRNDLLQMVKNGRFDKDQADFISQNCDFFIKYVHVKYYIVLSNIEPPIKKAQFMYINGVIKDPKALVAKNGVEYETEKKILRGFPLYTFWETANSPGSKEQVAKEELEILYKSVLKDKKR